jgi:hypothetical protein
MDYHESGEGASEGTVVSGDVRIYVSVVAHQDKSLRKLLALCSAELNNGAVVFDFGTPAGMFNRQFNGAHAVMLVLGVGYSTVEGDNVASRTLEEYRAARAQGIPVYAFIHKQLAEGVAATMAGSSPPSAASSESVLRLAREIMGVDPRRADRNPHIREFSNVFDLRAGINSTLGAHDDFRIMAQEPSPGELRCGAGDQVSHTWRLLNSGLVVWEGRTLRLLPAHSGHADPLQQLIELPRTTASELASVEARFRAPLRVGHYRLKWGMYSSEGRREVAWRPPLECLVDVI